MQEHMKEDLTFHCVKCAFTTKKKSSLDYHRRTAHTEATYVCEECGKNLTSLHSFNQHMQQHKPEEKRFSCEHCPKKFINSSTLKIHMIVHTDEKPYYCDICGVNLTSHSSLIRHKKNKHVDEKDMPFECDTCGKKFTAIKEQVYRDHLKTHTGERDHVCEICASSYVSKNGLRKHERAV